jgi:enamine deaminase RidA (YjgF/YER057c/UK114 family)
MLATCERELGDLEKIDQILQLNGFVNASTGFTDSPEVINGASDLLFAILGERGRHTRAAVAVTGLPKDSTIELQATIAIR